MDLRQIRAGWVKRTNARLWGLAAALVVSAAGTWWVQPPASRQAQPEPVSVTEQIPLSALPPQGQTVMAQIRQGGPFRYEKDGTVFGNREQLLPRAKRGYYREYTVPTPGLSHRGARRIVCGGEQARSPEACYYTEDHYSSFRRIAQ